jgi:hypothetical protein
MRVDMATLLMPDGSLRPTCVHCSTILLRKGMLKVVGGDVIGPVPNHRVGHVIYSIVPPHTIETLRAEVVDEHGGGRPWPD